VVVPSGSLPLCFSFAISFFFLSIFFLGFCEGLLGDLEGLGFSLSKKWKVLQNRSLFLFFFSQPCYVMGLFFRFGKVIIIFFFIFCLVVSWMKIVVLFFFEVLGLFIERDSILPVLSKSTRFQPLFLYYIFFFFSFSLFWVFDFPREMNRIGLFRIAKSYVIFPAYSLRSHELLNQE
jgi:hypothetical protein